MPPEPPESPDPLQGVPPPPPDDAPEGAPTPEFVFREYAPRIYHIARRMLGNDADAEDVTQDVLMNVARKIHTFRGESTLPTWLHRITVNAALAHREKRANRRKHESTTDSEQAFDAAVHAESNGVTLPGSGGDPETLMLAEEQRRLIDRAITRLPEEYRDIYVLADVEGVPNPEIAEMLNLSVPAVKSRLHRARLRMRDSLAPHFAEVAS